MTPGAHFSVVKVFFSRRQYTKITMEQLDVLVRDIRADTKRIRLLDLLGRPRSLRPTARVINKRGTTRPRLLACFMAEALVSEEDHGELKSAFALDCVCRSLTHRAKREERELERARKEAARERNYAFNISKP